MPETIRQDLRMRWGDESAWAVTVTDTAGAPVDITGCTMRFSAKRSRRDVDASAVFSKTVGSGITLSDPQNGVATVALSDSDTSGLAPGRSHLLTFDWRITLGGQTQTIAYGSLLVEPSMSRTV